VGGLPGLGDRASRRSVRTVHVSGSTDTVEASERLAITPTYSYDEAPQPNLVVRFLGRDAMGATARYMEYASRGARSCA
jgi:hypothetical protein